MHTSNLEQASSSAPLRKERPILRLVAILMAVLLAVGMLPIVSMAKDGESPELQATGETSTLIGSDTIDGPQTPEGDESDGAGGGAGSDSGAIVGGGATGGEEGTSDLEATDAEATEADPETEAEAEESAESAEKTLLVLTASGELDISEYLTGPVSGVSTLDLATLKDEAVNFPSGTLLLEGNASSKRFVRIIDSSAGPTAVNGSYDIVLGNYAGVELSAGIGALNSFGSISVKPGVTNILPVMTRVSVGSIDITGTSLTLESFGSATGTRGIVASGSGVVVGSMSIDNLTSTGSFNLFTVGRYDSKVFIGAEGTAQIGTLAIGNASIQFPVNASTENSCLIGASSNSSITSLSVTGNLVLTGLGGASYNNPIPLLGEHNGYIGDMAFTSSSNVAISNFHAPPSDFYGVVIGGYSVANAGPYNGRLSGSLTQQAGSVITFSNYTQNSSTIALGGDFNNVYLNGTIDITASGTGGAVIGRGLGSSWQTTNSLVIGSLADVRIVSAGYFSVAIGNSGSTAPISKIIVEKGATVDIAVTTSYSLLHYWDVEIAFGAGYLMAPKIMIGAVRDSAGDWSVPLGSDGGAQTTIRLNNLRAIGGGTLRINANVYAEVAPGHDFYGSKGATTTVLGGSYLVTDGSGSGKGTSGSASGNGAGDWASPFTVSMASSSSSQARLNTRGINQYNEALTELWYEDPAVSEAFSFHVPAANFGALPAYDFVSPANFSGAYGAEIKSLYFPQRSLYARLLTPSAGGTIAANGTVALEFDRPILASENLNQGKVITIEQSPSIFTIALNDASVASGILRFGSSSENGDDKVIFIDLSQLVAQNGMGIQADFSNTLVKLSAGSLHCFIEQDNDDPKLTQRRDLVAYSAAFRTEALPDEYHITFDLNGASGAIDSQTITEGDLVEEPEAPEWAGYTFEGWYVAGESGEGDDELAWDFAVAPSNDLTLVAHWSEDLVVGPGLGSPGNGDDSDNGDDTGDPDNGGGTGDFGTGGGTGDGGTVLAQLPAQVSAPITTLDQLVEAAEDQDIDMLNIGGTEIPYAAPNGVNSWALANLVLTVISLITAAVGLILGFRRRSDSRKDAGATTETTAVTPPSFDPRQLVLGIMAAVVAVAAIILLLLTEDFRQPMVLTDKWTILTAIPTLAIFVLLTIEQLVSSRDTDDAFDNKDLKKASLNA
ncbi:MAG: InlB B-repeat-containing protein [Coriobacteriales bacterium]|jgi:uncharacterized repeat protein (TIGR02543 family)|nr:InlB B-repeat-containing protein [Coriobacteriales bacterium]